MPFDISDSLAKKYGNVNVDLTTEKVNSKFLDLVDKKSSQLLDMLQSSQEKLFKISSYDLFLRAKKASEEMPSDVGMRYLKAELRKLWNRIGGKDVTNEDVSQIKITALRLYPNSYCKEFFDTYIYKESESFDNSDKDLISNITQTAEKVVDNLELKSSRWDSDKPFIIKNFSNKNVTDIGNWSNKQKKIGYKNVFKIISSNPNEIIYIATNMNKKDLIDAVYEKLGESIELEAESDNEFLEKPFGLRGKRVRIIKGDHKGKEGFILRETGYTGSGVVCKIKLDDGTIGEWGADFWEEIEDKKQAQLGEVNNNEELESCFMCGGVLSDENKYFKVVYSSDGVKKEVPVCSQACLIADEKDAKHPQDKQASELDFDIQLFAEVSDNKWNLEWEGSVQEFLKSNLEFLSGTKEFTELHTLKDKGDELLIGGGAAGLFKIVRVSNKKQADGELVQDKEKDSKNFYVQYNVGKAKYLVNFYDGVKKHEDGSDFYDIAIFNNKKDFEQFQQKLLSEGYIYRNGASSNKQGTGEPDQEYDHEFFDEIVRQLDSAGFSGATHREFDKYQGVYLRVPGVDKFWIKEVFYTGQKSKEDSAKPYTKGFMYNEMGDPVSPHRGDYFNLSDDHVLEGYSLTLIKQDGTRTEIDNPKVSDLPDIMEVTDTFTYQKGTSIGHVIFAPESDFDSVSIEVIETEDGKVNASELIEYVKSNKSANKKKAASSVINSYLETALWSSTASEELGVEYLDAVFNISDFSIEAVERAEKDWEAFKRKAGNLLNGLELEQVAHDFWLTRNSHGAGFWDGDYEEEVGDKLTEIAKSFGEVIVEVGDDGKLYFLGGEKISNKKAYFQDLNEDAQQRVWNNVKRYLREQGDCSSDECVDDFINCNNDNDSINLMLQNKVHRVEASKLSPDAQDFISKKIEILIGEGYAQDQAVAVAYSMAREKGYKVPKKSSIESDELYLYIENDANLYERMYKPIIKNLSKKKIKGVYDPELALKSFMHLVTEGAKKYIKENGSPGDKWFEMFDMESRKETAKDFRDKFERAFENKEYDFMKEGAKIDKFWIVTKPTELSVLIDIYFETDVLGLSRQFLGGLKPEAIVGIYDNEEEAKQMAKRLLKKRDSNTAGDNEKKVYRDADEYEKIVTAIVNKVIGDKYSITSVDFSSSDVGNIEVNLDDYMLNIGFYNNEADGWLFGKIEAFYVPVDGGEYEDVGELSGYFGTLDDLEHTLNGALQQLDIKKEGVKTAMWKDRLQNVYTSLDEFKRYDEMYGLVERLGFESAEEVWEANPTIQGSIDPVDYKVVNEKKGEARSFKLWIDKGEEVENSDWESFFTYEGSYVTFEEALNKSKELIGSGEVLATEIYEGDDLYYSDDAFEGERYFKEDLEKESKVATEKTLFETIKEKGIEFDSHESDLYIPKNEETIKLINEYKYKSNVTTFKSQKDGNIWYDVPFAFDPFWEKKKGQIMLAKIEQFQKDAKALGKDSNDVNELKLWLEAAEEEKKVTEIKTFPSSVEELEQRSPKITEDQVLIAKEATNTLKDMLKSVQELASKIEEDELQIEKAMEEMRKVKEIDPAKALLKESIEKLTQVLNKSGGIVKINEEKVLALVVKSEDEPVLTKTVLDKLKEMKAEHKKIEEDYKENAGAQMKEIKRKITQRLIEFPLKSSKDRIAFSLKELLKNVWNFFTGWIDDLSNFGAELETITW